MLLAQLGRWVAHTEGCFMRHVDKRHESLGTGFSGLLLRTALFMYKTLFILNTPTFGEFLRREDEWKRRWTDVSVLNTSISVEAVINGRLLINVNIFYCDLCTPSVPGYDALLQRQTSQLVSFACILPFLASLPHFFPFIMSSCCLLSRPSATSPHLPLSSPRL